MSPPQLAADTPVLDILQPVLIGILIFGWIEFQVIIHYRRQSHIGKVLHLEEPLHGELRLDCYVGTFGETDLIGIGFHLFQQPGTLQVFLNLLAYIEAVHAYVQSGCFAQRTVVVEDVDSGQVVFLAQHIVVDIVCRSYLQTARTELHVYIIILDNRNNAVHQRHNHFLTFQPLVLRVGRVDTHRRITHDCFGTRSGYHGITLAGSVAMNHFAFDSRLTGHVIVGNVIFQIIQFAVLFLIDNLFVAEGGEGFRVPVHHTHTAINQPFVVKVYKHFNHAFTAFLIHGEGSAVPIAGSAQLTKLFQDDATVLVRPFPGMLQEFVAGKVCFLDALCGKLVHNFGFGGNGSMVRTRNPAGVLAFHTGTAYKDILDGIIKHVSHVEHTGDVRGRNDDGVGLTTIGFRTE